jgi:hypothetical protein
MAQVLGLLDRRQDDARPVRIGLEGFDYRAERALDDVVGLGGRLRFAVREGFGQAQFLDDPADLCVDSKPCVAVRSDFDEVREQAPPGKPCADSPIRDEIPPGKPGGISKTRPSPAE